MTLRKGLLFAAIAIATSIPAPASAQMRMRPKPPRVEFPAGTDMVELPITFAGHLITAPVVFGGQTLTFALDTGASAMALADSKWIEALDLNLIGQARLQGAGSGSAVMVDLVGPISFEVGGIRVEADMVAAGIGELMGNFKFDGVFGAGLLSQTIAEIDYENHVLRLHNPESFEMPTDVVVLPTLIKSSGIAAVEAQVTIDGEESTHWLAVDIGAFHSLALDAEGLSRPLPVRRLPQALTIGWGAQGEVRGEVGVIDKLQLGSIELENVITTFPDKEGMRGVGRLAGDTPVIGNLGSAILRHYTVFVDNGNKRLGLRPRATPAKPFNFNTTGISARPTATDGRVPIHEVIPGSPAAEAGLVAGDVILEANGKTVDEHGGALRSLLMDPGLDEELTLAIERDGKRSEVVLVPRRLIS